MEQIKNFIRGRAAQVGSDVSDEQIDEIIEAAQEAASVIGESPAVVISFLCDISFSVPKIDAEECGRRMRKLISEAGIRGSKAGKRLRKELVDGLQSKPV